MMQIPMVRSPMPASPAPMSQIPMVRSPLVGTAGNFPFPVSSGLLGSLSNTISPAAPGAGSLGSAPPGATNWSQVALNMAGNPHAGPYANTPMPTGFPTGSAAPSGPSGVSSAISGLLGTLATNPQLTKDLGGLLGKMLGTNPSGVDTGPVSGAAAADQVAPAGASIFNPALTAGITAPATLAASQLGSPGIHGGGNATVNVGQPQTIGYGGSSALPAGAGVGGAALAAGLGAGAAPAGTVTALPLEGLGAAAAAAPAADALAAPSIGALSMPFDAAAAAPPAVAAGAAPLAAAGGPSLGAMAAAALPIAAAIYGPFSQPVTMSAKYWNNLGSALTPLSNGSPLNSPADAQLAALMDSAGSDIPAWLSQKAAQYGIKPLPVAGMNGYAGSGKTQVGTRTQKV